jgi:hypothetical protein
MNPIHRSDITLAIVLAVVFVFGAVSAPVSSMGPEAMPGDTHGGAAKEPFTIRQANPTATR